MKNQYIGDIGDYGKYGLLRFLESKDVRLGINWYMMDDDGKTDGSLNAYLDNEAFKTYDEKLFRKLQRITPRDCNKVKAPVIEDIEHAGLLENAILFRASLSFKDVHNWRDRIQKRDEWHRDALDALLDADLIFADPDNGLMDIRKGKKQAAKYILPCEIEDYFYRGQDVVYYHHRTRQSKEKWLQVMRSMGYLKGSRLLAISFHRWSNRAYIFVVHKERENAYQELIREFLASPWGAHKIDNKSAFSLEEL